VGARWICTRGSGKIYKGKNEMIRKIKSDYVDDDTYIEFLEMRISQMKDLLIESREALFNLAPLYRERNCFNHNEADCSCTACKIKLMLSKL
jgi:hypothetical protein